MTDNVYCPTIDKTVLFETTYVDASTLEGTLYEKSRFRCSGGKCANCPIFESKPQFKKTR